MDLEFPPRFSTPLTPGRPNLLHIYEKIAKACGWEVLQPWQKYVISLATEVQENGLPAYSEINLSLPRQNGKSVLMALVFLVRLLAWPAGGHQRVMLGAQDALSARRLLVDVVWPRLKNFGLADAAGIKLRQGGLVDLRFANSNHLYLMTSQPSSGHGQTLNTAIIDECWAMTSDAPIQAALPAMITIPDAQMWLCSTMGDEASGFWQARVSRGRAVSSGSDPTKSRTAYIEWSAPPDCDIDDPKVWAAANPAFGNLIGSESILIQREAMSEAGFRRAVLNQTINKAAVERIIPDLIWEDCKNKSAKPFGGIVLGIDAPPDRNSASVVAVDSNGVVELIAHKSGTDWLENLAIDIYKDFGDIIGVSFIKAGPCAFLLEILERAQVKIYPATSTASAIASTNFHDAILGNKISVRPDVSLDAAIAGATRRPIGQSWVWGRSDTSQDVSPLIAASLAYSVAKSEGLKPQKAAPSVVNLSEEINALPSATREKFEAELKAWTKM